VARAWRWSPTRSDAEVKKGVELYLYCPSGPSWPILGRTLPLPWPVFFEWGFKSDPKPLTQYLDTALTAVPSVQAESSTTRGCSRIGLHYGTGLREILHFYINLIAGQQEYSSRQAGITAGIVLAVLVPILLGLVCVAYQLFVRRRKREPSTKYLPTKYTPTSYEVSDHSPVR